MRMYQKRRDVRNLGARSAAGFRERGRTTASAAQRKVVLDRKNAVSGTATSDKKITNAFGATGWYRYPYDAQHNINDFSDNITTETPAGGDPVDHTSRVDLENTATSGKGEMRSGLEVDIVGASRSRHFSIADGEMGMVPADRKGKYTWHHLTREYEMELVDMQVHNDFWHCGGNSFWK